MTTVRFAPSPTGKIHIGNARTALMNWLFAKKRGGSFVLRYDDTDRERSKQEYIDAILADITWLGITPDRIDRQSERFALYDAAAERLRSAGLLYACYDSPDELERQRKRRLSRGLPPVYDRSALKLTKEEHAAFAAQGRKPHWRFLLPNFAKDPFETERTESCWDDMIKGPQAADLASLSDPVLIRGDGSYLYTLPSCVDDIEMGVTHVMRGDDHVTNTAVQLQIFKALGAPVLPSFGHHNLLQDKSGAGLSKRLGSLSIESLRQAGFEPGAIASLATLIGTSLPVEPKADLAALAEIFEPAVVTKSAAKFDPEDLKSLNASLLHSLSYAVAEPRLAALGIGGGEPFWLAIRANLAFFHEVEAWWKAITQPLRVDFSDDDRAFLATAASVLPPEPWDDTTWSVWTSALKEVSGRKGKALFMPLRRALTGLESGPELAAILPIVGRQETLARLP
ncbi:MAG: glutamate--tRNA ligase [Rhizobiales bacterium]|nr:glutamate--tRNA ligase [Hyphomicrobiales bacterium]